MAVETSGVIGPHLMTFFWRVGGMASRLRDELHETEWLLQHVSLVMVCGNVFFHHYDWQRITKTFCFYVLAHKFKKKFFYKNKNLSYFHETLYHKSKFNYFVKLCEPHPKHYPTLHFIS